jgi:hypothetical protein
MSLFAPWKLLEIRIPSIAGKTFSIVDIDRVIAHQSMGTAARDRAISKAPRTEEALTNGVTVWDRH